MSKTETAMKQTKYIKFSYRSPTKGKGIKQENDGMGSIPRIITSQEDEHSPTRVKREREEDEDEGLNTLQQQAKEGYVRVDEDYYSKLDKNQYPFSSKYIPMKPASEDEGSQSPILNNPSILLHQMDNYKTVSAESEQQWGQVSHQVVDSLRVWRKLYKILDNKKRQLKKAQCNKNSSSSAFKNGGVDGALNGGGLSNNSSNDSSNGNEESEDQVSSDNSNGRGTKRRKLSRGQQQEEDTQQLIVGEALGNGYSSNERKTRSTRSSR